MPVTVSSIYNSYVENSTSATGKKQKTESAQRGLGGKWRQV